MLNGTSSAGTTTLARAVQRLAADLWIVIGQDDFAQNLVPRWVKVDGLFDGGRGAEGFHFVRDDSSNLHVEPGEVGRRLLRSYRISVAACAKAGNSVVVDECKFDTDGWDVWQEALAGLNTIWVRVECDLDVCAAREAARADRRELIGLARGQYARTHADASYDLTVDLSTGDVDAAATAVLALAER